MHPALEAHPPAAAASLLIVDDDIARRQALCDALGSHGFAAAACGASDALPALRRRPAQMWLGVPTTQGIALLRKAREIDPLLVAIALPAQADAGTETARVDGFDCTVPSLEPRAAEPVLRCALALGELRRRNAMLERQLGEHAAQLEVARRELDLFTRSAAHDLRAPLNGVLGFSSLLIQDFSGGLAPQQRGWLAEIERAARQMGRLIDELMRWSRAGRQALSPAWIDMTALAREVADELTAQQAHPDLSVQIDALPPAHADAALVRQVLGNLLSNALKFTRHVASARVHVGHRDVGGAARAYFVRDNGEGFDMVESGKLFQPFTRLHRSDQFEGAGIGLSIVQRIVQRHGGRAWAEAEPGRGATFYFTLEASPSDAATAAIT